MTRYFPYCFLALAIVILYSPLSEFGYVQDDRVLIRGFLSGGVPNLSPEGKLFFRPFGWLYCYSVYQIFGMNGIGFHLLAVTFLFTTSLVVKFLSEALVSDKLAGWTAAFLYAGAANIHLDAQMWMVGIYDNGATLFALLSVLFFVRRQTGLSLLCLVIALGFKEVAVMALPIIFVYGHMVAQTKPWTRAIPWLHIGLIVVWVLLKSYGVYLPSLPSDDPYASQIVGWHVLTHMGTYATWVAPLRIGTVFVVAMMVSVCGALPRVGWFLVAGAIFLLIPSSILITHVFAYYLMTALPYFAIGVSLGIAHAPIPLNLRKVVLLGTVVASLILGFMFIQGQIAQGRDSGAPAREDGYNHLVAKSLAGE
jgi:hypothetical protein